MKQSLNPPKSLNSCAQVSVEFVIIIGVLFFFIAIFFLIIQENKADEIQRKQNIIVKEIALTVQNEINLASKSKNGYLRNFKIPQKAGLLEYEINTTSGIVHIRTTNNNHALALPTPEVTGNINITDNKIEKINGVIYLNQ